MAGMQATKEAIWLKKLLEELNKKIAHCYLLVIPIQSDNQGSMTLAVNPMGHSRSKHIDIQYHLVQEQLAWDIISLSYILTSDMATDGFRKALLKNLF